jgi:V/A-type H+-transporting ATPase subunit E
MDVKLESLIEKIKKEGVDQAQQQSEQIIKDAHAKEKEIVKKAKDQAQKIKKEAEQEAQKFQDNAKSSLKQAARNVILSVREKLISIFDSILKRELKESLTPEAIAKMLESIIDKWSKEKDKEFEVLVSKKDKKELEELILAKFTQKAQNKIEIKSSSQIENGFRIGIKGEDTHYDFSDEGITESLSVFLNPAIADLISDKDG